MVKQMDIVRQTKFINVAVAVAMCAAGVLLFLPLMDHTAAKMLIGVLYVVVGLAKICGYFSNDLYRLAFQYDLAVGLFALIFGVLFLVSPARFDATLPNSIGSYAILESVFKLQIACDARRFGMRHWRPILFSAILLCAAGVLTVISSYSDELNEDIMRSVALIAVGVENAWVTMYTVHVRARKKKFDEWLEDDNFDGEDV